MWRNVLAIGGGVLAGSVTAALLELPGFVLHPLPAGFDLSDQQALARHAAGAPLAAKVCVAVAWIGGPLAGTLVAGWIARRKFLMHGLIQAAIFVALVTIYLASFPHPAWLAAVGMVGPPLSSLLASRLAALLFGSRAGPQPHDMRERNMAC